MKRILIGCAVLAVLLAAWALHAMYADPPVGPQGEVIPPDEATWISQIVASGISMVNAEREKMPDHIYRRDAHAKTLGCATASFTVNPVDPRFRHGIFAQPHIYKAWVRLSSGSTQMQSDWRPDARGMAIKVLGVEGRKLLPEEANATTQDFLMINNPAFFVANVKEYALATHFQEAGNPFTYFAADDRAFTLNPFRWRLREFRIGLDMLKVIPRNLLATRFWSMTAYRLGAGQYVKYSAKPVACDAQGGVPGSWPGFGSHVLTPRLLSDLNSRPYCFDLMVQPQVAGRNMPVEDPTVEWRESDSAFVPLARIRLDRQDIRPQMESGFCEDLSFTPWHALPESEPVGGLNRIRKTVYQQITRYRHCSNGKALGEPKDDGSRVFENQPCVATRPIPE